MNGRELTMTTEPLDLRSLMRAAEGTQWSGIPGGTVIGHVHLHVGSLERAGTSSGDEWFMVRPPASPDCAKKGDAHKAIRYVITEH